MRRGPLLLLFTLSLVGVLSFALLATIHDPADSNGSSAASALEILLWSCAAALAIVFGWALVLFRREVRLEVGVMRSERSRADLRRNLGELQNQRRFDRRGNT